MKRKFHLMIIIRTFTDIANLITASRVRLTGMSELNTFNSWAKAAFNQFLCICLWDIKSLDRLPT